MPVMASQDEDWYGKVKPWKAIILPQLDEPLAEPDLHRFLRGDYDRMEISLGTGGQGKVTGISRQNELFALKTVHYKKLDNTADGRAKIEQALSIARDCARLYAESIFLNKAASEHVIRCHQVMTPNEGRGAPFAGLLLERMQGDLTKLEIPRGKVGEAIIFDFFRQGIEFLCYLSPQKIIHADIKPKNWLWRCEVDVFDTSQEKYLFKAADFGHSRYESAEDKSFGGTQQYRAPEASPARKEHQRTCCKSDLWSMFVCVMWALNCGTVKGILRKCVANDWNKDSGQAYDKLASDLRAAVNEHGGFDDWKDILTDVDSRPSAETIKKRLEGRTAFKE